MKARKTLSFVLAAVALVAALFAVPAVSEATGPRVAVLRNNGFVAVRGFFRPSAVVVDVNALRFRNLGVRNFGVRGFRALDVHDLRALEIQRALEFRRLGFGRDIVILR